MERDCESELSKLNTEQNACIYHFGASVIHGQRSNILRLLYESRRSCFGVGHLQVLRCKVLHGLNEELQEKGYLTISDSVNRDFFGEALLHQNDTSKGEIITAVCKEEKQHLTIC